MNAKRFKRSHTHSVFPTVDIYHFARVIMKCVISYNFSYSKVLMEKSKFCTPTGAQLYTIECLIRDRSGPFMYYMDKVPLHKLPMTESFYMHGVASLMREYFQPPKEEVLCLELCATIALYGAYCYKKGFPEALDISEYIIVSLLQCVECCLLSFKVRFPNAIANYFAFGFRIRASQAIHG